MTESRADILCGILIHEAVAEDADRWLKLATGLFAEDAGTRDRHGNVDWPRTHAG